MIGWTGMHRSFLFWGFKSSQELLDRSLGALERDVMTLAWEAGDITVRNACAKLGPSFAYTTIMTTMDRLFRKGLLTRRKAGRAYVYRAAATRREIEHAVTAELMQRLLHREGAAHVGGAAIGRQCQLVRRVADAQEREKVLHGDALNAVRASRSVVVYSLGRIVKDTGSGSAVLTRFKALLSA